MNDINISPYKLLVDVMQYSHGIGKYSLSHLHGQDRANKALDQWHDIEAEITRLLSGLDISIYEENK